MTTAITTTTNPLNNAGKKPPKLSTLLRKARAAMGPRGELWTKGVYDNGEKVCAIGAIEKVTRFNGKQGDHAVRARPACKNLLLMAVKEDFPGTLGVESWNDRVQTTWKDVSKAYRKAIKLAQQLPPAIQ